VAGIFPNIDPVIEHDFMGSVGVVSYLGKGVIIAITKPEVLIENKLKKKDKCISASVGGTYIEHICDKHIGINIHTGRLPFLYSEKDRRK
jgi:hypothetical protein